MLMPYPQAILDLIELFKTFPGVGKRSAERMALNVLKWDDTKVSAASETFRTLKQRVGFCHICGNLAERRERENDSDVICSLCSATDRDGTALCVVEEATQIRTIEAAGVFHGLYHVLGGRIAPLEGKFVDSLSIDKLEARLDQGIITEVILALSPDMEGQATAIYIANRLKNRNINISSPARGLPAGSDLSFADPETIAAAINGRISFK